MDGDKTAVIDGIKYRAAAGEPDCSKCAAGGEGFVDLCLELPNCDDLSHWERIDA